ncbi:hypothetical protein D5S17_12365 [Pseudonocardiaceae bacterium YIM PH 21723]|nr:hypothetical protein D5S17_12365 [Pseudonocardiaceae bacterium YIM PH 21723]
MRLLLAVVLIGLCWVSPAQADPATVCTTSDKRLEELSGLASDGTQWWAVGDGDIEGLYVLNRDCSVKRTIPIPFGTYDVEDMARAADGSLWLADTGDNRTKRSKDTLRVLRPNGVWQHYDVTLDRPRDIEALLLARDGTPYLISKEPSGVAHIFTPSAPLSETGKVPLREAGTVAISSTDTKGGPVSPALGSVLITGGAVSPDGSVVALRTYTDVYLYRVAGGDLVGALQGKPTRIPLADEPQGEAIAFEPDGTLLAAGEKFGPLRAIPQAVAQAPAPPAPAPAGKASGPVGEQRGSFWTVAAVGGVIAVGVWWLRRRRA